MFKLRYGYLISGLFTGFLLLVSFLLTLPDGKLHIVFCDVGQGDAAYIRFPDGRDMVIDGGPNDRVIACLGRHMPFWDRTIDMVALTHPQKDHMEGLLSVLTRYSVHYILRSDLTNDTESFVKFTNIIKEKKIQEKLLTRPDVINEGSTTLSVVWPSKEQILSMSPRASNFPDSSYSPNSSVLGASAGDLNDGSLVLHLRYGTFDALFPGDADSHVDDRILSQSSTTSDGLEILKVPHHGSKTAMTNGFLRTISHKATFKGQTLQGVYSTPLAVISVGKNSYGHPSIEAIQQLQSVGFSVLRTDELGDIEVVSDGVSWKMEK